MTTITHTFKEHVLRVIAVIGLIALLLLGAWGIIQLAFFIPGFLSRLSTGNAVTPAPAAESLVVSLPGAVASNQIFPLSWAHKNGTGQYSYAVTYACVDGVSVKAPLPNGTLASVACNTPFNYLNATNTTPVVVVAEGTSNSIATFTVTATKLSTGTVAISNSNKTTVSPVEKTVATPAKTKPKQAVVKPTSSYVAGSTVSTRTSNLYGSPDLQVRIINTPTNVRAGSAVSLQFVVENIGTNVTPSNWSFSASLPYQPVYTYQSPGQKALYPGDKIVYTLSYTATIPQYGNEVCTMQYPNYNCPTPDQAQWNTPYSTMGGYPYTAGYGTSQSASVTVDPMQYIAESNKANNYASVTYPIY